MEQNRFLTSVLARSLWAQTLQMLATALLASSVVVPIAYPLFRAKGDAELEKRGKSLVQTLEKHSDLRLAVMNGDAAQALPVLNSTISGDEDIKFVAILDKDRKVIAYAGPNGIQQYEVTDAVTQQFGRDGSQQGEVRRFTQEVKRATKESSPLQGLEFGDQPKAEKDKPDPVLGYVFLGLSTVQTRQRAVSQTASTIGVVSLALFALIILFYFRWVATRLLRMGRFAQEIATGELRSQLEDPLHDDLGQLAVALRLMARRTTSVVQQLVEASRSLSGASTDLFDSSSKQASNASKQAASVSEMGATVAELRETFNQATTKAESVIELARRSEESSSGGAEAVKESIDGMGHIRDQVAAIAQTIQGLVQRTDQIDAIIDVVNDLAEQSNVLALNAGIEAARAGEHGRGFAVVAREVRSLAERSKESTSQVRAILQDIKLAGRDAVTVIEEGSRRAETGMTVANAAGDAIKRLGDAIAASSAAAMQIASSTRQQSVGVEQIWQATKEIDRIATETANGIQQIEAAAGNMKSLSGSLAEVVGRYKV